MSIAQPCGSLPARHAYGARTPRHRHGGQRITIIVGRAGRHLAIRSKDHRP